mmetsp:Transcript_19495/g.39481  ORF Transcript_19495/g.39481 Transcript_19495/m.39481 type:complete len:208 (+) Transcript_19495:260-883(+)
MSHGFRPASGSPRPSLCARRAAFWAFLAALRRNRSAAAESAVSMSKSKASSGAASSRLESPASAASWSSRNARDSSRPERTAPSDTSELNPSFALPSASFALFDRIPSSASALPDEGGYVRKNTSSTTSSSVPASVAPTSVDMDLSPPPRFEALRFLLQLFEHVVTSSQHLSHFLRHVKGRSHTTQTFEGRFSFFTPRGMAAGGRIV